MSVKCSVRYLHLITLSMLIYSHVNSGARYRYVIAHTEPRVMISCFNPSHHRAAHGNSLLRASLSHRQRWHQQMTRNVQKSQQV